MSIFDLLVLSIFLLNTRCATSDDKRIPCDLEELYTCPEGETCRQLKVNDTTGVCTCLTDYTRTGNNNSCLSGPVVIHDKKDEFAVGVSATAIATGLLVPLISLAIIAAFVFIAKRYRWIHRIREQAHQLNVSSYDTVLVGNEEDTIG